MQEHIASIVTDAELVKASQAGDREAFGALVERYYSLISSLGCALMGSVSKSEEVTQDAFILAWRHLPRLREPERFRSWLFTITRNAAHRARRDDGGASLRASKSLSQGTDIPSLD